MDVITDEEIYHLKKRILKVGAQTITDFQKKYAKHVSLSPFQMYEFKIGTLKLNRAREIKKSCNQLINQY